MPLYPFQRQKHWAATLSLVFPYDHTDFDIPRNDENIASAGHVLLARSCPLENLSGLDAAEANDFELAMYADNPGAKGVDRGLIAAVAAHPFLSILLFMRARELPLSTRVVVAALLMDTSAARVEQPLATLSELSELILVRSPQSMRRDSSLQSAIAACCLLTKQTGDMESFPFVLARITERIGSVFPPFDGTELDLLQRFWVVMTVQAPEGALLPPVITFVHQLCFEETADDDEECMTEFCVGLLLSVMKKAPAAVHTYLLDYLHRPSLNDEEPRWVAETIGSHLDFLPDSARHEIARAILCRATANLMGLASEGGVLTPILYRMSVGFAQDAHAIFEGTAECLLITGTPEVVVRTFKYLKPFTIFGSDTGDIGPVDHLLRRATSSGRADPILAMLVHDCEQTEAVRLSAHVAMINEAHAGVYRRVARAPISPLFGITSCAICRTAMHGNGFKTPCDHLFHRVCIANALMRSKRCPICRIPVMDV